MAPTVNEAWSGPQRFRLPPLSTALPVEDNPLLRNFGQLSRIINGPVAMAKYTSPSHDRTDRSLFSLDIRNTR
ncbi:MAG: hypothetical protein ACLS29_06685 [Prevotellamassilia sp.]